MCFGVSSVPEAPLPTVLLAAFMFLLFANVLSIHGSVVARLYNRPFICRLSKLLNVKSTWWGFAQIRNIQFIQKSADSAHVVWDTGAIKGKICVRVCPESVNDNLKTEDRRRPPSVFFCVLLKNKSSIHSLLEKNHLFLLALMHKCATRLDFPELKIPTWCSRDKVLFVRCVFGNLRLSRKPAPQVLCLPFLICPSLPHLRNKIMLNTKPEGCKTSERVLLVTR